MKGQEGAIRKEKGPCVILAGAGTGKTYTIVEKMKYLIGNGIYKPERIVCITFSNEAANNLMSRVRKHLSFADGKEPVIKTFHAFSADLLRKYGDKIGISKEFTILTPDEAKVVLYRFLKVPVPQCHHYIHAIGMAKDLGIHLEDLKAYLDGKLRGLEGVDLEKRLLNLSFSLQTLYLQRDREGKKELTKEAQKIESLVRMKKFVNTWGAYEKIKVLKYYQDYSDLNQNALLLLGEHRDVVCDYDYLIVDEFQDTNKVQLDLLSYLTPHRNITVVGDLNQSIYRFRGAYDKNFQEFKEIFGVTKEDIFNLDTSFRSSNRVLRAAHTLILNNYSHPEECFRVLNHHNREGDKVEVYELKNAREEARNVLDLIERERKKGIDFKDICVMFRTHQQGRVIRQALEAKNIPYVAVSKSSLLKEKSIRMVIDYLRILHKLDKGERGGEGVWWDLIYQTGFSEEDLISVGRFMKDNRETERFSEMMLASLPDVKLSDTGKITASILVKKIKILQQSSYEDVAELIREVYTLAGFLQGQKTREEKTVMLNLNTFYELAKEHRSMYGEDLGSFLYYLEILDSIGIEIDAVESEEEGVRLMTLHATKGLEYKVVIITNLCQKRFPIEKRNNYPLIPLELSPEFRGKHLSDADTEYILYEYERKHQLSEERRLCYVAFTRAKEELILTYAQEYGGKKFFPSQFLHEVHYRQNDDFIFHVDLDEKADDDDLPFQPTVHFASILNKDNFDELLSTIAQRVEPRVPAIKNVVLSPSALLLFDGCQKKYEYKYIYNMPEQKTLSWEALLLGSFVHVVLDLGVKKNFRELKEFEDIAKAFHSEEEWESVELEDALHLIRVFFERNKRKYGLHSKTEQKLNTEIGGVPFIGFADRIDFLQDGIEIVDYKTGRGNIAPRARNWQLGYYALAASSFGKVRRITLDMLRHERPLEFEVDEKGNAAALHSSRMEGFNVYDVEQELIVAAHRVLNAYDKGFLPCSIESNCEFCGEYVWKL